MNTELLKDATTHFKTLSGVFTTEADKALSGNKAAMRRARKASMEIIKTMREFRKHSLSGDNEQ